ncbi:hypothetical protein BRC81_05990 [Halobacteriales archaeon QS_1_68_20]|nr:MAG: hypothetical protein BRC81_05990 [Halobacteriales archaeon QS_1_68_20]
MRRRQVLAATVAGVAGALAGCSQIVASLALEAVDDAGIAERYARPATRLRDEHRRLVADAVEEDHATHETTDRPFDPDRPVGYRGRYYEFTHEAVGQRSATRYGIRVDYDPDEGAGEVGDVDYADLPAVDRAALEELVPPEGDPRTSDGFDLGKPAVYAPEEAERSVLVPEQEYDVVVHRGERYLLDVDDGESVTLTEYRYTAEQVAADAAELAEQVRERYRFELTGLSTAQRKILDAAREDEYREEEPSAAFRDLVGRFRSHEAIEADEDGGEWFVRYDAGEYWADLETPTTWREATVAQETPSDY